MNIKKEVLNMVTSWKNQVGFMMELWQFYQDVHQEFTMHVVWGKLFKGTGKNPSGITDVETVVMNKDQGAAN